MRAVVVVEDAPVLLLARVLVMAVAALRLPKMLLPCSSFISVVSTKVTDVNGSTTCLGVVVLVCLNST